MVGVKVRVKVSVNAKVMVKVEVNIKVICARSNLLLLLTGLTAVMLTT